MPICIQYTSRFATAAETDQEQVEFRDGLRIAEVLQQLAERHGDAFCQIVFASEGVLQPAVMICANDEQVLDPLEHVLKDGDELLILSAISGG